MRPSPGRSPLAPREDGPPLPRHLSDDSARLASRTWETASRTLVIPLGSTEQHGPHLPLAVDALIAQAVADDLAARWRAEGHDVAVAPVVSYGASGEHEGFAGTVSIGTDALRSVIVEIGRSAGRWAERIVFVNGHGGNVDAVTEAVGTLRAEGRAVVWVPCEAGNGAGVPDAHAGRVETSIMLHLVPGDVREDRAAPGDTRPLETLLPALRAGGVAAVAPNGVLGDPRGASAAEGAEILRTMGDKAWSRVRAGLAT